MTQMHVGSLSLNPVTFQQSQRRQKFLIKNEDTAGGESGDLGSYLGGKSMYR